MADVVAFPLARRVGLIRKQAGWYVALAGTAGADPDRTLRRVLEAQRQALVSKRVADSVADSEVLALYEAIAREAWRLTFDGEASG